MLAWDGIWQESVLSIVYQMLSQVVATYLAANIFAIIVSIMGCGFNITLMLLLLILCCRVLLDDCRIVKQ